jgi:hypothetical protein
MLGQLITRTGSGQASYLYVNGPVTLGGTLDIVAGYGFQFAAGETFSVLGSADARDPDGNKLAAVCRDFTKPQ